MRNSHPPLLLNRRELLLFGGTAAAFPTIAFAVIPPPPPSLYLLLFIRDGIYQISGFYTVTLPASAGTCRSYNTTTVSQAFGANFTFTGRWNYSAWNMLAGAPVYKWWEVLDRRNGRYTRIFEGDRIEVKFADGSRVKLVFNGPFAPTRFQALVGTERLPDGTRLYPPDPKDLRGRGGGGRTRDGDHNITHVTPSITTHLWHWSTQDTPW